MAYLATMSAILLVVWIAIVDDVDKQQLVCAAIYVASMFYFGSAFFAKEPFVPYAGSFSRSYDTFIAITLGLLGMIFSLKWMI